MKYQRIILVTVGLFATITCVYSMFVGKQSMESGSTKPPCSNVATGRTSLQFTSIDLRYDLTDQANHQNLLLEFSAIHPDMISAKGSIRHLSNILQNADLITDESRRPYMKLTQSSSECTGSISHEFSCTEVSDYFVHNIPILGALLERLELDIRSMKASINNTQLCWNAIILVNDIANIVIDDDAEISCECSWCAVSKSSVDGTYVAARTYAVDDELFFEEVENTSSGTVADDDDGLSFVINYEKADTPPSLDKPIYRFPDEVPSLSWDAPIIIK